MSGMTREFDPDVRHVGRVPVVIRGRESRHGEGEQFELLGVHVI